MGISRTVWNKDRLFHVEVVALNPVTGESCSGLFGVCTDTVADARRRTQGRAQADGWEEILTGRVTRLGVAPGWNKGDTLCYRMGGGEE